MRTNYDYKSDKEIATERARFEALRYYFQDDDWFDKETIDRWVHNKQSVQFNIKGKDIDRISTTRIPTRCPKCKRAWAIEHLRGTKNKFGPNWLDPSVYGNIPMVKGEACDKFPGDIICKEYDENRE